MSCCEFIASLINSIAWPITVLIILLIYREQITNLIPLLRQIKIGEAEMRFDEKIEKIASQSAQPGELADDDIDDSERAALYELADVSPRSCVIEAWRILENEIQNILEHFGIPFKKAMAHKSLPQLLEHNPDIKQDIGSLLVDLKYARNMAVHDNNIRISYSAATMYADAVLRMVDIFKKLDEMGTLERN